MNRNYRGKSSSIFLYGKLTCLLSSQVTGDRTVADNMNCRKPQVVNLYRLRVNHNQVLQNEQDNTRGSSAEDLNISTDDGKKTYQLRLTATALVELKKRQVGVVTNLCIIRNRSDIRRKWKMEGKWLRISERKYLQIYIVCTDSQIDIYTFICSFRTF